MTFLFKWEWLPKLASGLLVTVEVTATCIAIGFVLGILLALARVYGRRLLSVPANIFIQFFRGTPLLVQLLLVYVALPQLGITISALLSAILALGLNTAAYQAEYFRGAIQSVKKGQMLAARSLGMSLPQSIRFVILPQALRLVIPAWSNELILMLKGSSIVYIVTILDIMGESKRIANKYFNYLDVYVVAALFYLALVLIVSLLLRELERRVRIPGLGLHIERR